MLIFISVCMGSGNRPTVLHAVSEDGHSLVVDTRSGKVDHEETHGKETYVFTLGDIASPLSKWLEDCSDDVIKTVEMVMVTSPKSILHIDFFPNYNVTYTPLAYTLNPTELNAAKTLSKVMGDLLSGYDYPKLRELLGIRRAIKEFRS